MMKVQPKPVPAGPGAGYTLAVALAKATGAPPPPAPPPAPQEDMIRNYGSDKDGNMWVECEVTSPPSMAGKTVMLSVPREQVPELLRAARDAAISLRSTPMGE